ncbi:hypothetical protein [Streptomyces tirandamycinicus]|uniref:hypothetical protein n=1 Tax=Streptomyces tirandamycinicus TaxID=2174846 RepID=UPI0011B27FDA|nr:hypothetical protein [Streptomyces tirandamycinicus]
MRVLGVHGVGNFRTGESSAEAARSLALIWRAALEMRLADCGLETAVAYFADLLRPAGKQGAADDLDDLDGFALELAREWFEALKPPQEIAAGPGTWPIRQAVSWLAQSRSLGKVPTERFVARFFKEVATYLEEPTGAARVSARARVAQAWAQHRPQIIIAHSLGSVVTYEALWERTEINVDLLITIGSPLALPHAVFPRLQPGPEVRTPGRPPGVRKWVNLADPGDIVAIPPGGISQNFAGVDVDRHTLISAFDFHLAKNYLASRQLADAVRGLAAQGESCESPVAEESPGHGRPP